MDKVVATYYFRAKSAVKPEKAARAICKDVTTGIWMDRSSGAESGEWPEGSVEAILPSRNGYIARIAFPSIIFERGNIPQYLSVIAGSLFELDCLESIRLMDIELCEELVPFHGPKFGVTGVRHLVGIVDRPLVGISIRPKIGLNPADTAEFVYKAAIGGVDVVTDSELLTNQESCPIEERVPLIADCLDDAKDITGQQVLYAANITSRADQIVDKAICAIELGANMIMVDVITAGFGALQALCEEPAIRVPIHSNLCMHAAMTANPEHGISMLPFARLVRLLGADLFHIRVAGAKPGVDSSEQKGCINTLNSPAFGLKRTVPVLNGNIHPAIVEKEISVYGTDIILQSENGIYCHPDGTVAGVRAMRQAVDAYMAGIALKEYAIEHFELDRALKTL
jgi:ribulose-bisphosphate carboxylase large chain